MCGRLTPRSISLSILAYCPPEPLEPNESHKGAAWESAALRAASEKIIPRFLEQETTGPRKNK